MKKLGALVFLLLFACGKRGDPKPPVPVIPKATSDLVVTQRGSKVILTWSYPSMTTAGKTLTGIRRVVIYRYVENLPATQPPRDVKTLLPGDVDSTQPLPIALFAKVPSVTPAQFVRLREKVDSIEAASLKQATAGAKLAYEDTPPTHTSDGRPVRLDYAVVTEGTAAKSDVSNLATLVPLDVAVAPANVAATPKPEGVVLTWSAPTASVTGKDVKPVVVGYDVYRTAGDLPGDLDKPLNAAPVKETTFTDVPAYGKASYVVTAVAAAGPPRIEGEFSPVVSATFKDLMPPPPPTNVTALVETKAVRLIWDPVEAPDLEGYVVWRTEGVGIENPREIGTIAIALLPANQTTYTDPNPNPGIAYKYAVSSKDHAQNESVKVFTPWVVVPKTP